MPIKEATTYNRKLHEKLNRLAELYKIRKEAQDEINELLQDPYIYDKWYGMQQGGIV